MPLELLATAPSTPELCAYQEPPLGENQVRVRSLLSAVKHGTELRMYRADTRDEHAPFDWERGMHIAVPAGSTTGVATPPGKPMFPRPLGNSTVGRVEAIGDGVEAFGVGDIVYGTLPIRETHVVDVGRLKLVPAGMTPETIVCWDPASVALSGVRDSEIGVGDRVLVIGLGAIGQLAAQTARIQGAVWVAVSDPLQLRRDLARQRGADLVLDPTSVDVGLAVKTATGNKGADAVIETSGSYAGLNDALRAVTYSGTVVSVAYYHGDARALSLEGEWHRNRVNLLSSRDVSAPHRLSPRWDAGRLAETAVTLLQRKALDADGLLYPVVPLADSVAAYRRIDEDPAASIKLAVIYG